MQPIDTSSLVYDRTNISTYEATDLNRVAAFCETVINAAIAEATVLADMRCDYNVAPSMHSLPDYAVSPLTVKKDFTVTDTYTIEQMQQYIDNVIYVLLNFPPELCYPFPLNMRYLVADSANAIELDLKQSTENLAERASRTEKNIQNTAAVFYYGGEIFAGGLV